MGVVCVCVFVYEVCDPGVCCACFGLPCGWWFEWGVCISVSVVEVVKKSQSSVEMVNVPAKFIPVDPSRLRDERQPSLQQTRLCLCECECF